MPPIYRCLLGTCLTVAALVSPLAAAARSPEGRIALTFDDLPGLTLSTNEAEIEAYNARLLAGLKHHHVPAIGFVNEGKLIGAERARQIKLLEAWSKAGMALGNHTFSHESPNTLGARRYIEDIERGEPVTRWVLAKKRQTLTWFRHPFLETGSPAPVRAEIDTWLTAHHYRVAPVTIDADDWEFADPYEAALAAHNEARAKAVRAEYLEHTRTTIAWSRKAAQALFGRDIAYVILLHDTRLNADSIDALADLLKEARLKPVSLDQAMADPAYRTADTYTGKDGIEWLERWSLTLHKDLPWDSFEEVQPDIVAGYNKIEGDPPAPLPAPKR